MSKKSITVMSASFQDTVVVDFYTMPIQCFQDTALKSILCTK